MNDFGPQQFSEQEIGAVQLGDVRRSRRLVRMLGAATARPGGKLTEVFADAAELQAAYGMVSHDEVDPAAIRGAAADSALRRRGDAKLVVVPLDGSSINLSDARRTREGLGPVGSRSSGARGLLMMTGLLIAEDGTPLGLGTQRYYARSETKSKSHRNKLSVEEKETRFWLEAMEEASAAASRAHGECRLFFQVDRGGDFRELLAEAVDMEHLVTVRAVRDRRVLESEEKYLWAHMEAMPPLGRYELDVTAGPNRTERKTAMEVRAGPVTLRLRDKWSNRLAAAPLNAVLVNEVGAVPEGEEPLSWLLITNAPVGSFEQACTVVFHYTQRWRVEQFHRVWKETCKVEDTQLHEAPSVEVWATLLAIVATRILRLTYLARTKPNAPATEELTREEVDAIIVATPRYGTTVGAVLPMEEAVRRLAELGGYTGKRAGPPGALVIARGLKRIELLALAMPQLGASAKRDQK